MRYRILGPLEVSHDDGYDVAVGGPQQQALLAVLLLNANRVVSTDRLVEELWGERAPGTARSLLQGCVAQLRRVLRDGDRQPLRTRSPGYLLAVRPGELDLDRFEQLAAQAPAADPDPDPDERARSLAEALSLWRGPALDGIAADSCQVEAARLEERRLAVLEERFAADLHRGRSGELIGELRAQVRLYPLRERCWALLIQALYAADRRADALAAYRQLRETLVDELGVEPGPAVQELHRQILAGADPVHLVPAQLPATTAFVGRARELAALDEVLADARDGVGIGVISGTAGVGKSALALHWAHRRLDGFPDGQLYAGLRGHAQAPPMRPVEALAGFLRALGVGADEVPVDQDQAAALFRSLLAGKRMLVVLDDAHSAEQVRPLLPGSPGCLVLVTCRSRLGGLVAREGGRHIDLDVLEPADATGLLTELVGARRVAAEPEATAELAALCSWLPLALRITAANLILHPRRGIADQANELARGRLDALMVGDDEQSAVRVAFDHSYAALAPAVARMFRLLGLVPGREITAETAAAPADVPVQEARAQLRELAGAHLVEHPSPGRFAFHDLLGLYARERAYSDPDRDPATHRLYEWYLEVSDAAARLLYPQVLRVPGSRRSGYRHRDAETAIGWLDTERANLVAAVVHAAEHGPFRAAWVLADVLRGYYWLRRHTVDWLAVAQAGLTAAECAGDLRAQASARFSLGMANLCLNRYRESIVHQSRALTLCRQAGWDEGEANAHGNLGIVHFELGELALSVTEHEQAMEINRRAGSSRGEAVNLDNLGQVHLAAGRLAVAADCLERALAIHRRRGDEHSRALTGNHLGVLYGLLGRPAQALETLTESLAIYRSVGNLNGQAMVLGAMATVCGDTGRTAEGVRHAEHALDLVRCTGDRYTEAFTRNRLGAVLHDAGQHAQAAGHHERALLLAREIGARHPEVEALTGLAAARWSLGRRAGTLLLARQAAELAHQIGYGVLRDQADDLVAEIRGAGRGAIGHLVPVAK